MDKLLRVGILLPESIWKHLAIIAAHEGVSRANFIRRKLDAAVAGRYGAVPMPEIRKPGRPRRAAAVPSARPGVPAAEAREAALAAMAAATPPKPTSAPVIDEPDEDDGYYGLIGESLDEPPPPRVEVPAPVSVDAPAVVAAVPAKPALGREALGPVRIIDGVEYAPLPDPVYVELYGEAGAFIRYNAALVDDGWEPIGIDEYRQDLATASNEGG